MVKLPKPPKSKPKKKEKDRIKEEGEFYFIKKGARSNTQPKETKPKRKHRITIISLCLLGLVLSGVIIYTHGPHIVAWIKTKFAEMQPNQTSSEPQPPIEPEPTYSQQELVNYALSLINNDRTNYGLSNVSLSTIRSGQEHAEDMLEHHYFSHWDTDGYKPYMRYTLAGGQGAVAENIARQHSSGPFDIKETIRSLEWSMMYDDAEWDWGHRDNILNPFHNNVSIGIAYDDHNLYLVQDFENDYINWSTFMSISDNSEVTLSGCCGTYQLSIESVHILRPNPIESNISPIDFFLQWQLFSRNFCGYGTPT